MTEWKVSSLRAIFFANTSWIVKETLAKRLFQAKMQKKKMTKHSVKKSKKNQQIETQSSTIEDLQNKVKVLFSS